jgi:hypothetical protein
MRFNLQPKQLLVLMDFTSFSLSDKPGGSVIIQDCIIVMEYLNENGIRVRRNLDFLCSSDTNKHDYHFVLQVWVWMFLKEHINELFNRIDVWTDGGPHHFKTRFCQWMWHALSELRFDHKQIHHHFFASYHGHSLADAHAALIKRSLNQRYKISQFERVTEDENATWGPATIDDVAAILKNNCSNTEVHIFKDIDRNHERKPDILPIPSIKSYHWFGYTEGRCMAFPLTNSSSGTTFSFAPN